MHKKRWPTQVFFCLEWVQNNCEYWMNTRSWSWTCRTCTSKRKLVLATVSLYSYVWLEFRAPFIIGTDIKTKNIRKIVLWKVSRYQIVSQTLNFVSHVWVVYCKNRRWHRIVEILQNLFPSLFILLYHIKFVSFCFLEVKWTAFYEFYKQDLKKTIIF